MLMIISSFIVVLYSIVLFMVGKSICTKSDEKVSKCIPMSYGMVMSTVVGLIVTFIYPNDLAVTTVISIVVSFGLALFVGMLFGLSGMIEALGASFMGAMMGAMLAAMTPVDRVSFIIVAMDLFFILFVAILLYYMKQHSEKRESFNTKKVALGASILVAATSLSLVTSVMMDQVEAPKEVEQSDHSHHH